MCGGDTGEPDDSPGRPAGEAAAKGEELVMESSQVPHHEVAVLANILPKTLGGNFLRHAYLHCRSPKTGSLANTLDD